MNINKTKIAIVANSAWNIYNFRLGLVRALMEKGFQVVAIAPPSELAVEIKAVGCQFIEIGQLTRKGKNPIKDITLLLEFAKVFRKEEIDVVLQYTIKPVIFGTLAAVLSKTKTINTITGLGYSFARTGIMNSIVKWLYRISLLNADKVFFQNQDDLNLFLKNKIVLRSKTGIVDGSGIDTDRFVPTSQRIESNFFNVLFVGRFLKDKGIKELIDAGRIINEKFTNVIFNLVGDIDPDNPASVSRSEIKKWIGYPWVSFHGIVNDTRPYIANSDVVVLPSYREGIPRSLLEAMSMAKPIITTDVPGCREIVQDGKNGFLIPAKNVTLLLEALIKMINLGSSKRLNMGALGREMVLERFEEKLIVQKYMDTIGSLLANS